MLRMRIEEAPSTLSRTSAHPLVQQHTEQEQDGAGVPDVAGGPLQLRRGAAQLPQRYAPTPTPTPTRIHPPTPIHTHTHTRTVGHTHTDIDQIFGWLKTRFYNEGGGGGILDPTEFIQTARETLQHTAEPIRGFWKLNATLDFKSFLKPHLDKTLAHITKAHHFRIKPIIIDGMRHGCVREREKGGGLGSVV